MTTKTDAEAALAYLIERRDRLDGEIALMRGRMTEIEYLISELASPVGKPNGATRIQRRTPIAAKFDGIAEIIRERGTRGITSQQLAEAMGTPNGTASSRLSIMKAKGLLTHYQPLYFLAEIAPTAEGEEPS